MTPQILEFAYSTDKYCGISELNFLLTQWCYQTQCSQAELQQNLMSNIFTIVGTLNSVAEEMAGGKKVDYTDLDTCFKTYEKLG